MARGLKFRIKKVEGLYYLCSENKGADQLRGYREADLRLCFRICKSPVFSRRGSFNIFIERIMSDVLKDHKGSIILGGRIFVNFRYADDIVVSDEEEDEYDDIVATTDTTRYKMEIGPDKTNMANNTNSF